MPGSELGDGRGKKMQFAGLAELGQSTHATDNSHAIEARPSQYSKERSLRYKRTMPEHEIFV